VLDCDFDILNGDEHLVSGKPGALAFVPRGTVHRYLCVGDHTGRMLLVCTPGGVEASFREAGRPAVGDGPAPPVDSTEIARTYSWPSLRASSGQMVPLIAGQHRLLYSNEFLSKSQWARQSYGF
jgi:hypothetical protein